MIENLHSYIHIRQNTLKNKSIIRVNRRLFHNDKRFNSLRMVGYTLKTKDIKEKLIY